MSTIYLTLNKQGRSSGRPSREHPKLLCNRLTGISRTVETAEEEQALGPDWGLAQPDVRYPKAADQ
jgi:hypothetical protein